MANEKAVPQPAGALRKWLPLGIVGVLAVGAGIVSTRTLGGSAPASAPQRGRETARAAPLAETLPASWPEPPDPKAMLLRLGLGTVLVLGLCVATLWFGRRWLTDLPSPKAGKRLLCLEETLPLGRRCCVYLLQVGTHQVLAGVDGAGLKTLVILPERFETALQETQTTQTDGEGLRLTGTAG